ncbi:DNA-binding response regulator, AraC family [Lachnospiraceae bacterium KM106-2]|nr:DNA-binding response regulator, AraC family [Lachnospiraceae bacterium KM106-2]
MSLLDRLDKVNIFPFAKMEKSNIDPNKNWQSNPVLGWVMYHQTPEGSTTGLGCSVDGHHNSFHAEHCSSTIHSHDYFELRYILKGEIQQKFGKDLFIFRENELLIIGRGVEHYELNPSVDSIYFDLFLPMDIFDYSFTQKVSSQILLTFLNRISVEKHQGNGYLHFKPKNSPHTEEYLSAIADEIEFLNDGYQYFIKGLLVRLLEDLSTNYDLQLCRFDQKKLRELIFFKVDEYMHIHYQTVSLEALCNEFHYSVSYFNKLIHEYCGESYVEHLQKIRLKKAKELLTTTDLSIKKIAHQTGYRNIGYFYKIFQKTYGVYPSNIHE